MENNMQNLDTSTIPDDLKRRMIAVGKIEWGAIKAKTDEQHIADFANTLAITRKDHDLPEDPRELHGVFIAGTETVVCHTGTSPNSPAHAQIIAGLWNSVIDALMAAPVPATPAE
jgi:hypothetical protein